MKKVILLFLLIASVSCRKEKVDGVIIGHDLFVHQSLSGNQRMQNLIRKALKKDKNAIIELKNFPNGGGAGSYDLGYVLTQIIYRIGEDNFAKIQIETPKDEQNEFEGLINVGLEYGDNDYDGKMDNKNMKTEFPKLFKILSE